MAQKEQGGSPKLNNENRAVLNRDFPRRGRSLVSVPEEVRRLYPNVKVEYLAEALAIYKERRFDDGESTTDAFGKVLAAVIIDAAVGRRKGDEHH